jgi:hypothetical protein
MNRIVYLLIIITLWGCKKSNDNASPGLSVPEITGINYRDNYGSYLGSIGIPNVRLFSSSKSQIITFPIPCENSFKIGLFLNIEPNGSERIWLVKAKWAGGENNISMQNKTLFEVGNIPVFLDSNLKLKKGTNEIEINTERFEDGLYKVYIQIENELLFDNLLIKR